MPTPTQAAGVLSFSDAYEAVLQFAASISAPEAESVPLLKSLGRVLGQPIKADRDFPPFPRATRDGYAVRSTDLHTLPARLRIVGQVKAGSSFEHEVKPGETVEIMTGAAVPSGADAVVMVEYTSAEGNQVEIQRAVSVGENVVPEGAEARAGQELLPAGTRISPAQIALAAAVGKTELMVFRKPHVAILSTGDELVEVGETPGPHQIRNSNTYSLSAQVTAAGGEARRLAIAPDEEQKLAALLDEGLRADMLLLSGGVSMGKFDLVEQALLSRGAEFRFTGAQIQPGKPVVFGTVTNEQRVVPVFGLPGNPVSVMVTFDLFVRPVLEALCGSQPRRLPSAQARLARDFRTKTGLTRFLPALLSGGLYDPVVEVVPWQGSGDLLAAARANCYLVVPPQKDFIAAGETVSVLVR
ncbi:MAG TPA: gephyrin-like molybdotransferase Glp [Candidatus Angelobacter sp.]|nr:gephyrin-like molybdotransferase Glp [Candidatus Angelobacter sp.]